MRTVVWAGLGLALLGMSLIDPDPAADPESPPTTMRCDEDWSEEHKFEQIRVRALQVATSPLNSPSLGLPPCTEQPTPQRVLECERSRYVRLAFTPSPPWEE